MLFERYVNNAEVTLQSAITTSDTDLLLTEDVTATALDPVKFAALYFMRATLSHASLSGLEIVFITSMITGVGNQIRVIRGREGTTPQAWPAGTKIQCRATAGMMRKLSAQTLFDPNSYALSMAEGENVKVRHPTKLNKALIPHSWAIGAIPVLPERGVSDYSPIASTVEGVGASCSVELGVAPNYDSGATYYPGAIVKKTSSPYTVYSMDSAVDLGAAAPALGAGYWSEVTEDADGGIFRVFFEPDFDDPDVWFYPSEIGFICDAHTATTTPSVSVGEVDAAGDLVSLTNLASAVALTAIDGAHQRVVLANNIKKGVRGLIFSIDTAATGGTFKGRFYWRGLFVCSNSAAGWPTAYPNPDGVA